MNFWKRAAIAAMLFGSFGLGACSNGSDGDGATPDPGALDGAEFNLDLTLELARLCLQSYQMLDDYQNGQVFALPAPYTLVQVYFTDEPFEGQDFSGDVPIAFVATKDENVYVVFRGTKTITEWIADAKIAQVHYPYAAQGLTEEGFTEVYATLHQDILNSVKELQASGLYQNLYVTGHSLGGALATLAAPVCADQSGFADPILYTFASPRTGNPVFADDVFDAKVKTSWRIVNTNDLVPKVPPVEVVVFQDNQPKTFFYEHVDTEFDITFGNPVTGPTDITDIDNNHSLCNYYNTFCDRTSDPATCKAAAAGADGCNPI